MMQRSHESDQAAGGQVQEMDSARRGPWLAYGSSMERTMASLAFSVQQGSDLAAYALFELELVLEAEIDGDQL